MMHNAKNSIACSVRSIRRTGILAREYVIARWQTLAAEPERGSESVETAIIAAIGLTIALALGAVITAAVHKYQNQLH